MNRAIPIMLVAMSMIPAGDSAGKLLSGSYGVSPFFVAWSRFTLGALLVAPFMPAGALALLRDWRIWVRAAVLACGITCIQIAVSSTGIATVFAAFFVGPIFSYVLAMIFLREPVTWARSLLILLGFMGVLLVVRPGFHASAGVLWAMTAGLLYGVFLTMSRYLTGVGSPLALSITQLAICGLLLLPLGLTHLPEVTLPIAGLTLASAFCSMTGNLLLLYAYQLASATRIAPLVYFQLIAAVGLGWAIFGDLPDALTWIGLAVIITAGLASTRLR